MTYFSTGYSVQTKIAALPLALFIMFCSAGCEGAGERKLHAAARTCVPGYVDRDEAYQKMDTSMRSQGYGLDYPGAVVGWKSKRVATDGGYSIKLLDHCLSGSSGLQLVFIEGSSATFSLEGWSRWYTVNETLEKLLEKQVVVEKHPWVNTPNDEDVIRYAQALNVRLPSDAIETLSERKASTEAKLIAIGICRILGDAADYPGCSQQ